ncbi:MAG TPA: acyl-ACP--UDP-N-acetylglucosamine O-acyltransferase [Ferruginibacter sp.]|nr:acyl-ACP--UDP-N-acetylglucosamine O-acyltransferase [Ferruginibacter sp.]HRO05194.1 acyl-ACP--UDP-N-acetylglucosamine O-acyltransferase [Ferruginibacter sp.]HRO95501.1 acyl-ACP--UDP-N-acetylglucosamine O-acyltransferase [Ferruginibacter sp.]HRP50286.1 acyl-ACP--UDP-N-acetylglucosamine O-acyltransferase [Ferruginibacter sp.]
MISPLAYISPKATIGQNVTIDPFAMIHDGVTVGDDCHIMSNVVLMEGTQIGKGCQIFPGAVLGGIPQDLKFIGEKTTVEIGEHTTIRECVTINRGTQDKWKTVVGSHCMLMAYVHIAHDCTVGDHVILANGVQLAGHVEVGDYAIIGGLSAAPQFTRIGEHTYIAGQSSIIKDVPPYIKAGRTPLCFAGINSVGLQRRGFSAETINEILDVYRHIYYKGMNISQALEYIQDNLPANKERDGILDFIRTSKRGITKLHTRGETDEY